MKKCITINWCYDIEDYSKINDDDLFIEIENEEKINKQLLKIEQDSNNFICKVGGKLSLVECIENTTEEQDDILTGWNSERLMEYMKNNKDMIIILIPSAAPIPAFAKYKNISPSDIPTLIKEGKGCCYVSYFDEMCCEVEEYNEINDNEIEQLTQKEFENYYRKAFIID